MAQGGLKQATYNGASLHTRDAHFGFVPEMWNFHLSFGVDSFCPRPGADSQQGWVPATGQDAGFLAQGQAAFRDLFAARESGDEHRPL